MDHKEVCACRACGVCIQRGLHAALYKNKLFVAAICAHRQRRNEARGPNATHRYSVFSGMPAGVEYLLVEVEGGLCHVLPQTTGPYAGLGAGLVSGKRATHLLRLERRLVRLEHDVTAAVDVEYTEVVVIRSRQHMPAAHTSASQPTQMKRV